MPYVLKTFHNHYRQEPCSVSISYIDYLPALVGENPMPHIHIPFFTPHFDGVATRVGQLILPRGRKACGITDLVLVIMPMKS